jgi:transcriptional regulator with XRE-family HTH domain
MPFNFYLINEILVNDGISRSDFANLLGITDDYLYRLESGQKGLSVELLEKMSIYSGIPIGTFFYDDADLPDTWDKPSGIKSAAELINRHNCERSVRIEMENRVCELERLTGHLIAVNELHSLAAGILNLELAKPEKSKKLAVLARTAAKAGELRFDEIAGILCRPRSTLRHWLESEKASYSCKLSKDRVVTAATPGEAGLRLLCFDCEKLVNESCRGFGENNYPENIFVLIALLKANGVYKGDDLSRYMLESYDIEISPHQISELLSRKKHGKPVPEDLVDLTFYRRK